MLKAEATTRIRAQAVTRIMAQAVTRVRAQATNRIRAQSIARVRTQSITRMGVQTATRAGACCGARMSATQLATYQTLDAGGSQYGLCVLSTDFASPWSRSPVLPLLSQEEHPCLAWPSGCAGCGLGHLGSNSTPCACFLPAPSLCYQLPAPSARSSRLPLSALETAISLP